MRALVLAAALLLASCGPTRQPIVEVPAAARPQAAVHAVPMAEAASVSVPARASYRDVGLKVHAKYVSRPWDFDISGRQLDQPGRAAREGFGVRKAWPEAIRFARAMGCWSELSHAVDRLTNALKIDVAYRTDELPPRWELKGLCRHYGDESSSWKRIQGCVARPRGTTPAAKAYACAVSPLLTTGMRELFDLIVVTAPSGTRYCAIGDPTWTVADPVGLFNSAKADEGMIDVNTKLAPLSAAERAALEDTHRQHHAAVTGSGNVQGAHLAYEQLMCQGGPSRCHFARIIDFDGYNDGHPPADLALIKRVEDFFHDVWKEKEAAAKWDEAEYASVDHGNAHLCRNLRGLNFRFFMTRYGTTSGVTPQQLTCAQWLAIWRTDPRFADGPVPQSTIVLSTPKPGATPVPHPTTVSPPPVGSVVYFRAYVMTANGSVNVPRTSTDPPLPVAINPAHVAAFPLGARRTQAQLQALGGDTLARVRAAVDSYFGAPVSEIRWVERVNP